MTHTNLPWNLKKNSTSYFVADGSNWDVFNVNIGHAVNEETAKANASFILTAVNSHYTLTDEVKRLREEKAELLLALNSSDSVIFMLQVFESDQERKKIISDQITINARAIARAKGKRNEN